MGHHIQRLTGMNDEVTRVSTAEPDRANEFSVRTELRADCYAGVWASTVYEEGLFEEGDLNEAFDAAEAIGDDRLQGRGGRQINTDSFTHGSSGQRRTWFNAGYGGGDAAAYNTFTPDDI